MDGDTLMVVKHVVKVCCYIQLMVSMVAQFLEFMFGWNISELEFYNIEGPE